MHPGILDIRPCPLVWTGTTHYSYVYEHNDQEEGRDARHLVGQDPGRPPAAGLAMLGSSSRKTARIASDLSVLCMLLWPSDGSSLARAGPPYWLATTRG